MEAAHERLRARKVLGHEAGSDERAAATLLRNRMDAGRREAQILKPAQGVPLLRCSVPDEMEPESIPAVKVAVDLDEERGASARSLPRGDLDDRAEVIRLDRPRSGQRLYGGKGLEDRDQCPSIGRIAREPPREALVRHAGLGIPRGHSTIKHIGANSSNPAGFHWHDTMCFIKCKPTCEAGAQRPHCDGTAAPGVTACASADTGRAGDLVQE